MLTFMSIALGFFCSDGIALAADSQFTAGGSKRHGRKIFPISSTPEYSVAIAGAGAVPEIERAAREIRSRLVKRVGTKATTTSEVKDIIEDWLQGVYTNDVGMRLLVAAWARKDGLALLKTERTNVVHADLGVDPYACVGEGGLIAGYLIAFLSRPGMLIEEAKPLAAYIVSNAKQYVDGCGGRTSMQILRKGGAIHKVRIDEIVDAENYFERLFKNVRYLLHAVNIDVPIEATHSGAIYKSIKDNIASFRSKQAYRKALERRLPRESNHFDLIVKTSSLDIKK
jgi:20S proteasome alpha/beta subunit